MQWTDGALRARCVLQVVRDDLSTRSKPIAKAAPVSTVAAGLAAFAVCRADRRLLVASLGIAAAELWVLTDRARRRRRATAQHCRAGPSGRAIHAALYTCSRDAQEAARSGQLVRVAPW